jgi:hypothetical protein
VRAEVEDEYDEGGARSLSLSLVLRSYERSSLRSSSLRARDGRLGAPGRPPEGLILLMLSS